MNAPDERFEPRPISGEDVNGETYVRIWDAQKYHPFAEGKVIAYTDLPTAVIEHIDGTHSQWVASLPWEHIERLEPLAEWELALLRSDDAGLRARAELAEARAERALQDHHDCDTAWRAESKRLRDGIQALADDAARFQGPYGGPYLAIRPDAIAALLSPTPEGPTT